LQTWISSNFEIRIYFLDMKHSWTKNSFWDVNIRKWRKWCKFVSRFLSNNAYGLPVLKKNTKNSNQVFYVSLVIYRLLVIIRAWKRESLQIIIFVYICSSWNIVELRTRFETCITRSDVNGVRLFHLSYLITLMAYLCSQWTLNIQIKYFMFDWSIYRLFVLNNGWKCDSLKIKRLVYHCSTCCIVELHKRFETWNARNDVNGVSTFLLSYWTTLMAFLRSQWTPNV
jgi:hypothetical protein